MPIDLKVKFKRLDRISRYLDRLSDLDMKAIHEDLGQEMVQIIEQRFDDSKDPNGQRWKAIKKYIYTAQGKRPRNPEDKPLKVITLHRSFQASASPRSVIVGTPVKYAKFHTDFPQNNQSSRKKIPLREFLGVESGNDEDRLLQVLVDHVEDAGNV